MALQQLSNLEKARQLKPEPADQVEFANLITTVKQRLQYVRVAGLSETMLIDWRRSTGVAPEDSGRNGQKDDGAVSGTPTVLVRYAESGIMCLIFNVIGSDHARRSGLDWELKMT